MERNSISVSRIFGIPIRLDYSWFLVLALLTWNLAAGILPAEYRGWPAAEYWGVGLATALVFFASVLLHELGHSAVALRYHIPVRRITLFIFGGIAEIGSEPPSASAEFWIASAGPAVSFALAGLFAALQLIAGSFAPLVAMAGYLASVNAILAAFNLIPAFPLDGGRVFRAIVWALSHNLRRATIVAATLGRIAAFLFILFGIWQAVTGNLIGGLWIVFIGWFLERAAESQIMTVQIQTALAGHRVSEVMSPDVVLVSADTKLQYLVADHVLADGRRSFGVVQGETLIGWLTPQQIRSVPFENWAFTTAGQIMTPLAQAGAVAPDTDLSTALAEMERGGVSQLPVVAEHSVRGVITRNDIAGFLRSRGDLGWQGA